MPPRNQLIVDYPWLEEPVVACAPMRMLGFAPLAAAVTQGGGLGFIGIGMETDTAKKHLDDAARLLHAHPHVQHTSLAGHARIVLPVAMGIILHSASLPEVLAALQDAATPLPCAVWLFAPSDEDAGDARGNTLDNWIPALRQHLPPRTPIWLQVGSVAAALASCTARAFAPPEVLVVQGSDAGGHGLAHGASLMSLLPEVATALEGALAEGKVERVPTLVAAGGIADGRGVAAALALGASGAVMGTRYLACTETNIADGYRRELVRASDGGSSTVRSRVYDTLRGTSGWPSSYNARGVVNASYHDAVSGMDEDENKQLYKEAVAKGDDGWGPQGRMTTYAGTAVGLVRDIKSAAEVTREVREQCREVLQRISR